MRFSFPERLSSNGFLRVSELSPLFSSGARGNGLFSTPSAAALCMLRAALALALAALVKSDYLLTQFFPGDGGCVGEALPGEITNGVCSYTATQAANPFSSFVCISPTAYNTSYYSTISCSGAPNNSVVQQLNFCQMNGDFGRGFVNQVCLSGVFDPGTSPIPVFSNDHYNIAPGSPGAATCPPTVGSGVAFYSRFYINNFALGVCEPAKRGRPEKNRSTAATETSNSYIVTCNPNNAHTLRVQGFRTLDCSGPEDPPSVDESGCGKESETVLYLLNPGTQCLSPPPASSTSGASLSPAGLIGVGVGIGLMVAALAFAAHALFRNYYYLPLGAGTDAAQSGRARSLPSDTSKEAAAAAASMPLLSSGGGKAARTGGQFKM